MSRVNPVDAPQAIALAGPTASGKTAGALALAAVIGKRMPVEIISVDSALVYRGMDIGTAKPTTAERAAIPHHLIDIADPRGGARGGARGVDGFTVDDWLDAAEHAIAAIRARGCWPIIVGGTNFYIKAFLEGMFEGPQPDPALRRELEALDQAALRTELERVDPPAAARIHPNDRRRTIRALEVFRQMGHPISALQSQWDRGRTRPNVRIIGLDYLAAAINPRINARVKAMMAAGLADEVKRLWQAGDLGPQAREALGYKQLIDWLEGRCTLDEAVEQIKIRTRRYAKQQRTWLRRFRLWPNARWFEVTDPDAGPPLEAILGWVMESA